ncbi:TRAP transporter substrate-binding protein [Paradesulfitobacterium ferrireducens]|uniref:TRAP transporter substrate-binding protein n=1 Tax=Paradesulfitobacterium ferrireducens TaxID=2816476 RepID=UPI001F3E9398
MRRFIYSLLVFMLIISMIGCGSTTSSSSNNGDGKKNTSDVSKEKIKLTYAFFAPANTFPAVQMTKWKEELEKRTNGKVEVQLFPGGSLLNANNMYEGVGKKVADIGLSVTTYEPGRYPLLDISDLPSGYPNAKVASQVVNDLIKEYPPEALKDYKIITSFATEPAFIQSKAQISNLEELKGKQLRIAGALTPIMKALGAAPVGMSQAEAPEALQTGIIVGNVSSREVLKDFKLAEIEKYVTDYPLTLNTFVAVMNKDVWNSLPPDVQKVIDELNSEMAVFAGDYLDNHVKEAMEWSKKEQGLKVVTLDPEEKKKWDILIQPLQDQAVKAAADKGLPAENYKKKLYELIAKYSK